MRLIFLTSLLLLPALAAAVPVSHLAGESEWVSTDRRVYHLDDNMTVVFRNPSSSEVLLPERQWWEIRDASGVLVHGRSGDLIGLERIIAPGANVTAEAPPSIWSRISGEPLPPGEYLVTVRFYHGQSITGSSLLASEERWGEEAARVTLCTLPREGAAGEVDRTFRAAHCDQA